MRVHRKKLVFKKEVRCHRDLKPFSFGEGFGMRLLKADFNYWRSYATSCKAKRSKLKSTGYFLTCFYLYATFNIQHPTLT